MSSYLPILHFNDVYRVTPQKISKTETIDVTQFAALADDLRDHWPQRPDGKSDGLFLFSGDAFSPSVESSVTRGSHMVPVLNDLNIDVSVTGNHDFDFGYPHLSKLLKDSNFPWLLSNIIDTTTSRVPEHLHNFVVIERAGTRIGFIGLVEKEWISTVSSWPPEFVYQSMKDTGMELSKLLRDPDGDYRCDLIIALTHSRLPNDIILAKDLFAFSPSAQKMTSITSQHGVDLLLGGHDHIYFVSQGVTSWENFDVDERVLGAESDNGDILVVKSGSDFRDLSEINLKLASTPNGSVRKKVISEISGKRHITAPRSRSSESMTALLKDQLSNISSALKAPLCRTTVMIDVRSYYIRVTESPIANWLADISRHAYDNALCLKGGGGSDGVLFCAGTFRGDSTYGPGIITIGDILEILPFEDSIVVLEIDGATLWDALESSLKTWPAQEGRFPVISGFRVSWDSRRKPGNRLLGIWLLKSRAENNLGTLPFEEEPIKREIGTRKYKIMTREYMAQGHDGFEALTRGELLIDDESGSMLSTIIRQYSLVSQFVNKVIRLKASDAPFVNAKTRERIDALGTEFKKEEGASQLDTAAKLWRHAATLAINHSRSSAHYRNHFKISVTEHMSEVDAFDGEHARKSLACNPASYENDNLLLVTPEVDGRLKDEGSPST